MRTNNSIKNSITAFVTNMFSCLIAFIAQAFFVRILGAEYLGLNGLFTNILTMLSFFELGIGSAIVYNLYKPIADNDEQKIKSLMFFYKKAYNFIALAVFVVGLAITPFIKFIVGEITIDINIYLVYILFLLSTVSSYIVVYKRSFIIANQQNYIINLIHMSYLILLNVFQIIIIYFTKNFYLYLVIKILCQLLENIFINIIANKKYPYLKAISSKNRLDNKTEKDIYSRVKALILHKVAGVLVNGTDNIIISYFLGIVTVGLYSNYLIITNAVNTIFNQVITSATASVGNLLIEDDYKKRFDIFKKMRFVNFWISTFTSVSILVIIQPFISIWLGSEYLIAFGVVCVIVFNFFQKMQRNTYATFKDSAGIWKEDKFVPLVEASLNIIFSILCLKIFGLAGVFLGTIISGLALWCYSYPKFVYKNLFKRSYMNYAKETLGYISIFILIAVSTYSFSTLFVVENLLLQLVINTSICILIPNFILLILFWKNDNMIYFKELFFKILNKLSSKVKKA